MPTPALAAAIEDAFVQCRDLDASLGERMAALNHAIRDLSPLVADALDRMIARLADHDLGARAPQVGEVFPGFMLPDETGRLATLDEFLRHGPVAVAFHRGTWCPFCRLNTIALAQAHETIATRGGKIVAIVPDRQQFTTALKQEARAQFPVLTDLDNAYGMSLNLTYWMGAEIERLYRALGCELATFQGNSGWLVPIPATFVVGTDGRVKMRFVDPDFRNRVTIEQLVAAFGNGA